MKRLLGIGALSGLAAGVALALFLATVGRSPIRAALALEESAPHDHGGAAHEDLFSRGAQEVGGAIGLILYGVAVGLIFAVVLGSLSRHLANRSPMAATGQLALVGFLTVVVVPFVKYPANPPAVGSPDTINERTVQYLSVLIFSVLWAILVWQTRKRLATSPASTAWITAGAVGVGLVLVAFVLPESPDPVDISADVVWQFRIASLLGLACAWCVMALVAGALLSRPTLIGSVSQDRQDGPVADHDAPVRDAASVSAAANGRSFSLIPIRRHRRQ